MRDGVAHAVALTNIRSLDLEVLLQPVPVARFDFVLDVLRLGVDRRVSACTEISL